MPVRQAKYSRGELLDYPIFLDNLVCSGTEMDLLTCSCNINGDNGPCVVGDTDCSHYEDAGVRCEGNIPSMIKCRQMIAIP